MTNKFTAIQHNKVCVLRTSEWSFAPIWSSWYVNVGDKVYMGKRTNNHHGELPVWELWEHIVQKSDYNDAVPKIWYGKGRYLFKRQET